MMIIQKNIRKNKGKIGVVWKIKVIKVYVYLPKIMGKTIVSILDKVLPQLVRDVLDRSL